MPSTSKRIFRPSESRSQPPSPKRSRVEPLNAPQAALEYGPSYTISGPVSVPPAPIEKGQNYGVKILYDGGAEAVVDIIFVHGLTGNAYDTWLHEVSKVHWPSQLLKQEIPDSRILSFGYDADIVNFWNAASNCRLTNHAETLVGDFVRERERTETECRKILFVAHSLGGLIVEYALFHSRNAAGKHLQQIEHYTAGIVFLGVPHCGADLAAWGKIGAQMIGVLRRSNKEIVGALDPRSELLRIAEKNFHNILRLRKDEMSEILITSFYEELSVRGVGEV